MDAEFAEYIESESESESESEAEGRRGRWPSPPRASGTRLFPTRIPTNGAPASQGQVAAAMARVGDQLKTNSAAVATVNSRLNTVNSNEKKDNEERRKDLKAINEKIQLLALLPLLLKPTTTTLTSTAGGTLKVGDKVMIDSGDTLTALLPLLLM